MFKPKLSCPRCDQSEKISSLFPSDVRNQLADRKEPLNYVQGVDWSCLHQSILATTPTKIEQIYWRRSWPLTAELKVTFVSGEKAFWLKSVWVYITLHPENWETFSLSFKFSSLAVVVNFKFHCQSERFVGILTRLSHSLTLCLVHSLHLLFWWRSTYTMWIKPVFVF